MTTVSHTRCSKCAEIKNTADLIENLDDKKIVCKEKSTCEENRLKNELRKLS